MCRFIDCVQSIATVIIYSKYLVCGTKHLESACLGEMYPKTEQRQVPTSYLSSMTSRVCQQKKNQYEIKTWYFAFMVTFSTLITIKLTINLYYIIWFCTIYDMLHDTFICMRNEKRIFFFWKFLQIKFDS